MQEEWRTIPNFAKYGVSNLGRVETLKTQRILNPTTNQHGHLKVNLMESGVAHTRSLNRIVAGAFLAHPPRKDFTSLIHIDGDKKNCQAENLDWRPRHFAIRYHQQFQNELYYTSHIPVVDLKTGTQYRTAQEAAVTNGLIFTEILVAAQNRTYVWPTFQEFRIITD